MDQTSIIFSDKTKYKRLLSCNICDQLLSENIYVVETRGNACSSCFNEILSVEDGKIKGIQNIVLGDILPIIKVPCEFTEQGCTKMLPYLDLGNHLITCRYKLTPCPARAMLQCQWEDQVAKHEHHFQSEHKDLVVNNPFEISFNFTDVSNYDYFEILRFIKFNGLKFLLKIILKLNDNSVLYAIYNYGEDKDNLHFTINVLNTESFNGSFKATAISGDIDVISNQENFGHINLNLIQNLPNVNDNISFEIKLLNQSSIEIVGENFLQHFECSVCKKYMKAPIYQCTSGHSICSVCKQEHQACPDLKCPFGSTRNYVLEEIANRVQFPCSFFGCDYILPAKELKEHEVICAVRILQCPYGSCKFSGVMDNFQQHLQNEHAFIENSYLETEIIGEFTEDNVPKAQRWKWCFLCFGTFFVFSIYRGTFNGSRKTYWRVALLEPIFHRKFIFEIGVSNLSNKFNKLMGQQLCSPSSERYSSENSIVHSDSILMPYSDSQQSTNDLKKVKISFYCKIVEVI